MENVEIEKHNCALDELYRKRDEALKCVVALISENKNTLKEDQELEKALDVLTDDGQRPTRVQLDDEAGDRTHVHHLLDDARLGLVPGGKMGVKQLALQQV